MKPKTIILSDAVSLVAWGYLFQYLNINLGPVDILPNWLGYGMMLRALPALEMAVPAADLLRPLARMLAAWQGLLWVLNILRIPTTGPVVSLLSLVLGVVGIYFHFQLLTNLAEVARQQAFPDEKPLLHLRTINTLLVALLALPIRWTGYPIVSLVLGLAGAVVGLWICVTLFYLRRHLQRETKPSQDNENAYP